MKLKMLLPKLKSFGIGLAEVGIKFFESVSSVAVHAAVVVAYGLALLPLVLTRFIGVVLKGLSHDALMYLRDKALAALSLDNTRL